MRIALETRNDVYVRMIDDLSGVFAVVHHQIDPVGIGSFLDRLGKHAHDLGDREPIGFGNIKNGMCIGVLGYYERVSRTHGMNIEKCQHVLVLVHSVRRQFSANDFGEYGFAHVESLSQPVFATLSR